MLWGCLGVEINLTKSKLVPVGEDRDVEDLARMIGCKVGSLLMNYLGFPLINI